jgi:hypothetical protein
MGKALKASLAPWSTWSIRSVFWHCRPVLGIISFYVTCLAALMGDFSASSVAVSMSISNALVSLSFLAASASLLSPHCCSGRFHCSPEQMVSLPERTASKEVIFRLYSRF